jgi:hypothetical protein
VAESEANNTNFIRYMANPKAFTLKKWFYDLLQVDYAAHDAIIERVAAALTTDKDLTDFGKLISQVFEKGFRKAVEEYSKEAERIGLKVSIIPPRETN